MKKLEDFIRLFIYYFLFFLLSYIMCQCAMCTYIKILYCNKCIEIYIVISRK